MDIGKIEFDGPIRLPLQMAPPEPARKAIEMAVIAYAIHQLRAVSELPIGGLPDRVACLAAAHRLEDALRGFALPIAVDVPAKATNETEAV